MQYLKTGLVLLALMQPLQGFAQANREPSVTVTEGGSTVTDVVLEIPVRIVSVGLTAVGAGLFTGTAIFSGLMSAIPPHNAFNKAFDGLVMAPFKYTFQRPVGDWDYDATREWDH